MSLEVDPQKVFSLTLKDHDDAPVEQAHTYVTHYLTAQESDAVDEKFEESDSMNWKEGKKAIVAGLKLAITGWKNINEKDGTPAPFDLDKIDKYVSRGELLLLRHQLLHQMTISDYEKKTSKCVLRSTSATIAKS